MELVVRLDVGVLNKDLDTFLEGLHDLFQHSKGMFFSVKDAGNIAIKLCSPFMDKVVDQYVKNSGERGELDFAEYYYAKALAYAMASKAREGRVYWEKARVKRTGGRFYEWAEPYYS